MMRLSCDFPSSSPVSVMQLTSLIEELDSFITDPTHLRLGVPTLIMKQPVRLLSQQHHHQKALDSSVTTPSCKPNEINIDGQRDGEDENDVAEDDMSVLSNSSLSTKDDMDPHHELRNGGCSSMVAASRRVVVLPANSRESVDDRRSIFSHYWGITGQQPADLLRDHAKIPRSKSNTRLDSCEGVDGDNKPATSSSTPVASSGSSPSSPPDTPTRRSIFGGMVRPRSDEAAVADPDSNVQHQCRRSSATSLPHEYLSCSVPTSPIVPRARPERRRATSASSFDPITMTPNKGGVVLSSCLRPRRLSLGGPGLSDTPYHRGSMDSFPSTTTASTTSAGACSVSFDERVRVYTFKVPQENWSDGSWKKIFGF